MIMLTFAKFSSSKFTFVGVILFEVMIGFVHVQSECPGGWSEFSSSCYNVQGGNLDWDTAFSTCQGQGASIVEIASAEENSHVNSISNGWYIWLYCRDHLVNGEYVCGDDNHPITYTAWGPLKPADNPGFDCVMFLAGTWSDVNCAIHIAVVCEKDADIPVASTEQPMTSSAAITTEGPISTKTTVINAQPMSANGLMQKDPILTGYCLVGHVIKDIQSTSLIRCLASCIRLPSCSSMNVFSHEGRCQLNDSNRTMSSLDFQEVDNCDYFEYVLY
ncbi:low affinity immunoglobulin epsilon Fc receptor [Strongylocentrotus purpuratus]|uniref:C-type lectin domain-containing protein n=1 Tax=Strongylocentrotus purpuratus TaxID=7668 RepID=A0A7M7T1P9_STRPU|nr:low affinity immunoglobulin epsilon Fc receptor [Strongylocentrotus purpuratus]